jgi:hypothetical protein
MKYLIHYYFDGDGRAEVEANSEEEAKEKWSEGDYKELEEGGENYIIDKIEEI